MASKNSKAMTLFRKRVQHEIKSRGLTVTYLAECAGISRTHLSQILNGATDTTVCVAERIADSLDVSFIELFAEPAKIMR